MISWGEIGARSSADWTWNAVFGLANVTIEPDRSSRGDNGYCSQKDDLALVAPQGCNKRLEIDRHDRAGEQDRTRRSPRLRTARGLEANCERSTGQDFGYIVRKDERRRRAAPFAGE